MKYTDGGVEGTIGEALTVEVELLAEVQQAATQALGQGGGGGGGGGGAAPAQPDPGTATPQTQPAATGRTRMSIWSFGTPLLKVGLNFDEALLDKIKAARVDDFSLVDTLAPPESNWAPGGVVKDTAVSWSDAFKPGGMSSLRDGYLTKLISSLHDRGVQVMLGYCIGNGGYSNAYCKSFCDWLQAMSEDQVKAHAVAVADFVKKYKADGIGFDLELVALGEPQRANLKTLYSTVASELKSINGLVSYANAPFTGDGTVSGASVMSGMKIQGFDLARDVPNLIARPMCYDTNAFDYGLLGKCVEYALGPAGLQPSQLQLGLFACDTVGKCKQPTCSAHGTFGTEATMDFIKTVMQPKRVAMIHYSVAQGRWDGAKMDQSEASSAVGHVADFEALLNAGEAAPGAAGAPLQVPRV